MATDGEEAVLVEEGPSPDASNSLPSPPRWLADEMVGRLARYLRFLGHDTVYAHGLKDREVEEMALRERRILLTRDRALAHRVPGALLLTTPNLPEQIRAIHRTFPSVDFTVRFDRCSLCNGELRPAPPVPNRVRVHAPREPADSRPRFECVTCGHRYWEGSHTARVRRNIAAWLAEGVP